MNQSQVFPRLTAAPADSLELELLTLGTTIVPVTSVKPLPMSTAPAQFELYSTWVSLSKLATSDFMIGWEERVLPDKPRLETRRASRLWRRFSLSLAPRAASAQSTRLRAAVNFILAEGRGVFGSKEDVKA